MCKTRGLYSYFSVCDLCFLWGEITHLWSEFLIFFFYVFTSVFHHLRHVLILFTKLSTETMLSSVLESGFIFSWAFPFKTAGRSHSLFLRKRAGRHMTWLLTFILTHIPKRLASFHLRATPTNLSRSDHVCWGFWRHVLSRTIQVDPEVITEVPTRF